VGDGDLGRPHATTVNIDSTYVNSYGRIVSSDASVDLDGRRLRREQNREAVITSLVDLFHEGNYQPSAAEIATRAGLSQRSLFRYFDDVDDLNRAAIERQQEAARPLLDPGVNADAPTAEKVDRIVSARIALYETIEPGARATRVCAHRHPVVAAQLRDGRSFLRHQLERLFAPELAARAAPLFPAIDALLSFETHQLLRHDRGLSRQKTHASLTAALTALLNATGEDR
jgi:TetR/AcrR family transcriptional regulator of autoinduction and epiphytic fitness